MPLLRELGFLPGGEAGPQHRLCDGPTCLEMLQEDLGRGGRRPRLGEDGGLAEKAIMTRMLLAEDGTLAFGLEDELFLVPTGLGPMADSVWPCGGGNAGGNPAFP